jgi:AraC-like DNA-binding protein
MIATTFTTQSLRPLDQVQSWQEWFSPVFEISPIEPAGDEFHAQNTVWSLGDVMISRVLAPSVHVKRRKANLAKAPVDHWVLTYCRQGATAVQTPKGEFNASGGVPFLWSLGEEFESKRTRVDRIQILMSREALSNLTPLLDASRGSALETPWGGLLGDYIIAVERWLPSMTESDIPRLAASVRNMVAACIAPSAERTMLAQEEIESGLLERARRTVQTHLRSPRLRPNTLCRILGISRSQLYRLFERTGGVVQYIQRQRLLSVWALLCDPTNQRAIADVAADFCFEDASSFGRAFRREFGHSASDVRSAAKAGIPLAATRRTERETEAVRFADFFDVSRGKSSLLAF